MRRGLYIKSLVVAAAVLAAAAAPAAASALPSTLQLGRETVTLCEHEPLVAYCGSIRAPLDRGVYAAPTIKVAFRWYPADDGQATHVSRTVVPVEGGPGYPSIGSVDEGYAPMYGSLLHRWNMLAIDNRGTGESTVIRCPALQDFSGPTATEAYEQAGAQCAKSLNERWRAPDGEAIHASGSVHHCGGGGGHGRSPQLLGSARSTSTATHTARITRRSSPPATRS